MSHYGDWQAEFEAEALVYYERYADDTAGFFGGNVDNLADDKTIVGDGYAVALSAPLGGTLAVTYSGKSETFNATTTSYLTSAYGGTTYYLYPVDMLTTSTDTATTNFYHSVSINGRTYQFNPYFAKTVTTGSGADSVPGTIYLRTARHLYELSRHYGDLRHGHEPVHLPAGATFPTPLISGRLHTSFTVRSAPRRPSPAHAENDSDTGGFRAAYERRLPHHRGRVLRERGERRGHVRRGRAHGTVRNVTLLSSGTERVERSGLIQGSTTVVYMGVLAGRNYGTISNCAVSGYSFGSASGVAAYQHSTVYLGGLVGGNLYHKTQRAHRVQRGQLPLAEVSALQCPVYAGGFTGSNAGGSIQSCYALGVLKALDVSAARCGCAASPEKNTGGALAYCYSATALTAAGEAEVYGLTRVPAAARPSATIWTAAHTPTARGYTPITHPATASASTRPSRHQRGKFGEPALYGFPKLTGSGTETVYPYPAVVRDAAARPYTTARGPSSDIRHDRRVLLGAGAGRQRGLSHELHRHRQRRAFSGNTVRPAQRQRRGDGVQATATSTRRTARRPG